MKKDFKREYSPYTLKRSATAYAIALGMSFGLNLVIGVILLSSKLDKNTTANLIAMAFLQFGFFAGLYIAGKKQLKEVKLFSRTNTKAVLVSLAIFAVSFIGFLSASVYFSAFLDHIGYEMSALEFGGALDYVLAFVVIGLLAPIVEELVFRYALLNGLKKFGNKTAIVLCSLAFMLMHMNPEQTTYQFLLGISITAVALYSSSVVNAMIIHAANNLTGIFLDLFPAFSNLLGSFYSLSFAPLIAVFLFAGAAVALVFLLKLLKRVCPKTDSLTLPPRSSALTTEQLESIDAYEKHEKKSFLVLYVSMVTICAAMWVLTFLTNMAQV